MIKSISDLRDDTASRLYANFLQIIGDNVSKDKTLDDEYIDNFMLKAAPYVAEQAIKIADIFIKKLEESNRK